MSPSYEIHSIFVEYEKRPVEICLSRRYAVDFEGTTIRITQNPRDKSLLEEPRVASFTTLFGKNGCGKTALLIELCQTFSETGKGSPLGVLYSRDGRLFLHKGRVLRNWEIARSGENVEIPETTPRAPTIFYSTSPFESARRANLKRMGTLDVSPSCGESQRFDGLALILNYHHISGEGADICHDLELSVRGRISRERTVISIIKDLLDRHGYEREQELIQHAKRLFSEWLVKIPKGHKQILLANLIIISDTQGNHNVVGKFVGELMRLAQEARQERAHVDLAGWEVLAHLSSQAIAESGFMPFDGHNVVELLGKFRSELGVKTAGISFTLDATPSRLKTALDNVESWRPGAARFLADLGFLEFELKNLSSGEFAFVYLYAAIGSAFERMKQTGVQGPVWLLIDEGEMFLHPAWQREYVKNILDFVDQLGGGDLQIHVMISTHSLIVAADAPPNSLFDAEFGRVVNGFALGPESTLSTVYGVVKFTGENTGRLVDELVRYLSTPTEPTTPRIRKLAAAVADEELKAYVNRAILERILGAKDAETRRA